MSLANGPVMCPIDYMPLAKARHLLKELPVRHWAVPGLRDFVSHDVSQSCGQLFKVELALAPSEGLAQCFSFCRQLIQ